MEGTLGGDERGKERTGRSVLRIGAAVKDTPERRGEETSGELSLSRTRSSVGQEKGTVYDHYYDTTPTCVCPITSENLKDLIFTCICTTCTVVSGLNFFL